jgi:hypothetical protein
MLHLIIGRIYECKDRFDAVIFSGRDELFDQFMGNPMSPKSRINADDLDPGYSSRQAEFEFSRAAEQKSGYPIVDLCH